MDKKAIARAVTEIIKAIGDDPRREGLKETPRRVAEMYTETLAGMTSDPAKDLATGFEEGHHEMVILSDIPFYSLCEHHLLPFFGVVHIGYIPNENGRVVGASKLGRVVDCFAKRLQIQERMTTQIADTISNTLEADGVAVVIQAEHLCMTMRGIKKPGSNIITSANRGFFRRKMATRAEFLALVLRQVK